MNSVLYDHRGHITKKMNEQHGEYFDSRVFCKIPYLQFHSYKKPAKSIVIVVPQTENKIVDQDFFACNTVSQSIIFIFETPKK